MDWEGYWENLLEKKKLKARVDEMDQADQARNSSFRIEDICRKIYDNYQSRWRRELEEAKVEFQRIIEGFQGVHLHSSRIKTIDSLLVKVITKRYENLTNLQSPYYKINGENYKDVITDLIGMRLIVNYRGKWEVIHREILRTFPYVENLQLYENGQLIPHAESGSSLLAEIPKVYYAQGDQVDEFKAQGLETRLHKKGYRSIHYTVSFKKFYIEIQVRTIYDEAWSDCDHNYVYKQDENKSHSALESLSQILCDLTNISNDIGENMREIFESESVEDLRDGSWSATAEQIQSFDQSIGRIEQAYQELKAFRSRLRNRRVSI
ncbi:hypothetical protein C806_03325 [Lachnospiraceae bacterium 3-1]|nr:hypothetical protein C806_03325 [Lachnospiraceae bacterium 3-1]